LDEQQQEGYELLTAYAEEQRQWGEKEIKTVGKAHLERTNRARDRHKALADDITNCRGSHNHALQMMTCAAEVDLPTFKTRVEEIAELVRTFEEGQTYVANLVAAVTARAANAQQEYQKQLEDQKAAIAANEARFNKVAQAPGNESAIMRINRSERTARLEEMKNCRDALTRKATQWEKDQGFIKGHADHLQEKLSSADAVFEVMVSSTRMTRANWRIVSTIGEISGMIALQKQKKSSGRRRTSAARHCSIARIRSD
jgi:hypothetical protein